MQLHRWKIQLICNLLIFDHSRIVDLLAFDHLSCQRTGRDRRSTPECFELGVHDVSFIVHLDLELHDVTASWSSHQPSSDIVVILVHGSDISRVLVVVDHFRVVGGHLGHLVSTASQKYRKRSSHKECHNCSENDKNDKSVRNNSMYFFQNIFSDTHPALKKLPRQSLKGTTCCAKRDRRKSF